MKRFVNEDTVLGGIMNGQSLNRFAYVNGNPISYIDPEGKFAIPLVIGGADLLYGLGVAIAGSMVVKDAIADLQSVGKFIDNVIGGTKEGVRSKENSKSQSRIAAMSGGNSSSGGGSKGKGRSANDLKSDPNATGSHTTFKRDPSTGKITNYETWKKTDPRNPNPFESEKRFDGKGEPHTNKVTKEDFMPHVHDKTVPGNVRVPYPWELPLGY